MSIYTAVIVYPLLAVPVVVVYGIISIVINAFINVERINQMKVKELSQFDFLDRRETFGSDVICVTENNFAVLIDNYNQLAQKHNQLLEHLRLVDDEEDDIFM